MAIVKFVTVGSPMNNIFNYVMCNEATERKLFDGLNCTPESALDEFKFVKKQFGKDEGRMYYHIIQSFAPNDNLTPETAHEIGMRLAEYFPDYQVLVATHENTNCLHNHLIMNSVNFRDGKKFHQSRDEMLQFKEYSNQLCREYGLSVTEVKTKNKRNAEWKRQLIKAAQFAMLFSSTKEGFVEQMREHGYGVRWEDNRKYITFTTPEGYKVRDNKLFDERLLKDNLEIYFAMGGCEAEESVYKSFCGYRTPEHSDDCLVTLSDGLKSFLGDVLSSIPESCYYQPQYIDDINTAEKLRLEKILGRKISREAFVTYCTREQYEQEQGLTMQ